MTRKTLITALLLLVAASAFAAPGLYTSPTKSKWSVKSGGSDVATVTLFTDGTSTRAEWLATGAKAPVVFVGTDGKVWIRGAKGDLEYAAYNGGTEKLVVPALLLPTTVNSAGKVDAAAGKLKSYTYKPVLATYKYDASGLASLSISAGAKSFAVARVESAKFAGDPTLYTVHPQKTSQVSKLAGNLFGKSDTSVSATAGPAGAGEKGLKFKDGGDYDAVLKLENRDEEYRKTLSNDLAKFQKEGSVGEAKKN
jgi:hypothetical protein